MGVADRSSDRFWVQPPTVVKWPTNDTPTAARKEKKITHSPTVLISCRPRSVPFRVTYRVLPNILQLNTEKHPDGDEEIARGGRWLSFSRSPQQDKKQQKIKNLTSTSRPPRRVSQLSTCHHSKKKRKKRESAEGQREARKEKKRKKDRTEKKKRQIM